MWLLYTRITQRNAITKYTTKEMYFVIIDYLARRFIQAATQGCLELCTSYITSTTCNL